MKKVWYTDPILFCVFTSWALAFVFIKIALVPDGGFSPLAFVWPRMFLSAVILFALMPLLGEPLRIPREHLLKTIPVGVVGLGLYHVLFTSALSMTTPVDTALIIGTGPVMTALWMPLFRMERTNLRGWLGVVICFATIAAIAIHGAATDTDKGQAGWNTSRLVGDIIMLVAANCWALNGILCRRVLPHLPTTTVTAYGMLWASIVVLPFCAWSMLTQDWVALSTKDWWCFIYAVLPASTISIVFFYFGVRNIGPLHTIIYQNISPIITAITMFVMFQKMPSVVQAVGMFTIFLGVWLTRTSKGGTSDVRLDNS